MSSFSFSVWTASAWNTGAEQHLLRPAPRILPSTYVSRIEKALLQPAPMQASYMGLLGTVRTFALPSTIRL